MSVSKNNKEQEDYLDEDRPIPGQKYVCLSFVSPENVLEDKNLYTLYKFMKNQGSLGDVEYEKFKEDYKNYNEDNEEEIQEEFNVLSNFQTNVRGVKVRGVYDSERAANIRAQVLQKMDSSFHVYVGQVGFWLPWEPNANKVQEQEYLEDSLNKLVKEYNKNQVKKDIFYEQNKSEQKKAAIEEAIKQEEKNKEQKRLELEQQKLKELENSTESTKGATESTEGATESTEGATESTEGSTESSEGATESTGENISIDINNESNLEVTEELKENLEKMDPWMERKINEN